MTKKQERDALYNKTNGRCAYCGCDLPERWHADHMEPVLRYGDGLMTFPENDNFENKIAACPSCNIWKGGCGIDLFRTRIKNTVENLHRDTTIYKFAKRFGLIKETNIEVKFYFESLKH